MRELVHIDERKAIPRAWKQSALERTNGQCARLDCSASTGLEFDHILALALGGKHAELNIEPLCREHHKIKTRRDIKMIAKAKRQARETGKQNPDRKKKKLQSRGFQKHLSKGFDGKVRKRER